MTAVNTTYVKTRLIINLKDGTFTAIPTHSLVTTKSWFLYHKEF